MKTRTRRQERAAGGLDPLAVRLADGDPTAPRDLVERHYAELYRYAFAVLREEQAAEDAVQDAFERALSALEGLPDKQRVAVTLRYLQDLPYAEISGITGWPEGTVKTLVHRGLAQLKGLIIDDSKGGDPA